MPSWDEITPHLERETGARRLSAVTVLIAINIAGLVVSSLSFFLQMPQVERLLTFDWQHGIQKLWLWQFFTYTFWHSLAGGGGNQAELLWSILGLVFGCWILHGMGRELEREWGWKRFTVFYLGCGVYGAVAHAGYQVFKASPVGAFDFLGPVLAVLLTWALREPRRRVLFLFLIEMSAIMAALLFIGLVFLYCLSGFHTGMTPVATLGAVAAAYGIHLVEPRLDARLDRRETRLARERFLSEFELKRAVDTILEKISREGIGSLTSRERKLLKRASELQSGGSHGHE